MAEKDHPWEAVFAMGTQRYTTGHYPTMERAIEEGRKFASCHEVEFIGAAQCVTTTELEQISDSYFLSVEIDGRTDRRYGRVTRCHDNESYGFITDSDGMTWFFSKTNCHDKIAYRDTVEFVGNGVTDKARKRHPTARAVRRWDGSPTTA